MNINGTNSIGGGNSTNATAANPTGLGKEDFLKLLIAQMENQSPLDPMDNTAFVAQLAQFSSVEQQALTNDRLDTIALAQAGVVSGQSVNMVGKTAVYPGNKVELGSRADAPFRYQVDGSVSSTKVSIKDANGRLVRTLELGAQQPGIHNGLWDGLTNEGAQAPSGSYTFEIEATDSSGDAVASQVFGIGKIDGVTFEKGYPQLVIGDQKIDASAVLEIRE
jgi:flagellar basal-body rod modification protein FlgD